MPDQAPDENGTPSIALAWLRFALFVLIVAGALALGRHFEEAGGDPFEGLLAASGPDAALVYLVAFVLLTLAFVPATPLVVVGGVLFGPLWGTVLAYTGGLASAAIAYALGRLGAGPFRTALARRVQQIGKRVDLTATTTIMLLRMVLIFPFAMVNYGLGLAQVPPRPYFAGTLLGDLPWMLAFAILGAALGSFTLGDATDPRFLLVVAGSSVAVLTLYSLGRAWAGRSARQAIETSS